MASTLSLLQFDLLYFARSLEELEREMGFMVCFCECVNFFGFLLSVLAQHDDTAEVQDVRPFCLILNVAFC